MGKYFLSLFVLVAFTGCNIFSWTWSEDGATLGYEEYAHIFAERINSGRYLDAIKIAEMMIELDSTKSDGYFFKAKAARYKYFNKYFVIQELIKRRQEQGVITEVAEPRSVPFLNLDVFVQESIYVGNRIIMENLHRIYHDEALGGRYERQHVALDYFFANSVYAILNLRDLLADGSVLNDTSVFSGVGMTMTQSGVVMENFDSLLNRLSNPIAFNDMLDRTANLFEESFAVRRVSLGDNNESVRKVDSILTIISGSLESLKIHDSIINPPNIIFN